MTNDLNREVTADGPEDARIVVVTDFPTYSDRSAGRLLSDYAGRLLFDQFRQTGVLRSQIRVEAICEAVPPHGKWHFFEQYEKVAWQTDALERLSKLRPNVFVLLGDLALQTLTDKRSSDKWQLSVVPNVFGTKALSVLHPERVRRVFKEIPFLTLGATRAVEESRSPEFPYLRRNFRTGRICAEVVEFCQRAKDVPWLSVDIETGRGQITCLGLATSPTEAMCIPTLTSNWSTEDFFTVWSALADVLTSPVAKIFQNAIYDTTFLSRYGIRVANLGHDTMIAQKFLHPELPMGLDTVARVYTKEPYWKDDAKEWGLRQDIQALYEYNQKDVCVTYEAAMAQRYDLLRRGLLDFYEQYLITMTRPVEEMCWRGLPVNTVVKDELRTQTERDLAVATEEFNRCAEPFSDGKPVNPRSPAQLKVLLKRAGFRIPFKDGKESTDRESIMKLRLKDPGSRLLATLVELSVLQKRLSSYLNFEYDTDGRMRYSLLLHGTETGRMACHTDPWGRGLNAQTIPQKLRVMFESLC